jgi:hypothetical protein
LRSAAQVVAADVAYCRSLAVAHNSQYVMTFNLDGNRYVIMHSGTDSTLDALPPSPFRRPQDPPDEHRVDLAEVPQLTLPVRLAAVQARGNTLSTVSDLEFGPLGETTRTEETLIWLAAGAGPARRFVSVRVNPVTGLTKIEDFRASTPPGVVVADPINTAVVDTTP